LRLIEALKSEKKGFDRSVDCPVELHFGFCFQQNAYGGGSMAEGHRQRVARIAGILPQPGKNGPILGAPVIAGIARNRRHQEIQKLTTD
jgi:hypothetical protein